MTEQQERPELYVAQHRPDRHAETSCPRCGLTPHAARARGLTPPHYLVDGGSGRLGSSGWVQCPSCDVVGEREYDDDIGQQARWCYLDEQKRGDKSRRRSEKKPPAKEVIIELFTRWEQEPILRLPDHDPGRVLIDPGPRDQRFALMLTSYQKGLLRQEASARRKGVGAVIGEALREWVCGGRRYWTDCSQDNDARIDLSITEGERRFLELEARVRVCPMSTIVLVALDAWFRHHCADYEFTGLLWEVE